MADPLETEAFSGTDLPLALGACRLSALPWTPITSVAPYPGGTAAAAALLGDFPAPGGVLPHGAGRLVWAGRDMAFVFDAMYYLETANNPKAIVHSQSDGWAGRFIANSAAPSIKLRGVGLALGALPAPGAARSVLNAVPLLLIKAGGDAFELWSFRSMAGTLRHELDAAMRAVAARRAHAGDAPG